MENVVKETCKKKKKTVRYSRDTNESSSTALPRGPAADVAFASGVVRRDERRNATV